MALVVTLGSEQSMLSSANQRQKRGNMKLPNASSASFGVRWLLRRGCLALVLGWFALWLGAVAHAACAVPLVPAGSSGPVVQVGTITSAPQHSAADSGAPDCQQLLDASMAAQSAAAFPVFDDQSAKFTSPPLSEPLVVRVDDSLAGKYLFDPSPPGRILYLRTSRLLI